MSLSSDKIIEFLEAQLKLSTRDIFPDSWEDVLLFSTGILDSFHLMDLIVFIERESGKKIHPRNISLANFDSVQKIIVFLSEHDAPFANKEVLS